MYENNVAMTVSHTIGNGMTLIQIVRGMHTPCVAFNALLSYTKANMLFNNSSYYSLHNHLPHLHCFDAQKESHYHTTICTVSLNRLLSRNDKSSYISHRFAWLNSSILQVVLGVCCWVIGDDIQRSIKILLYSAWPLVKKFWSMLQVFNYSPCNISRDGIKNGIITLSGWGLRSNISVHGHNCYPGNWYYVPVSGQLDEKFQNSQGLVDTIGRW